MIVRCSCPDRGWCSLAHTSITFHLYNQATEVKVRTRHLIMTYNTYYITMLCRSGCWSSVPALVSNTHPVQGPAYQAPHVQLRGAEVIPSWNNQRLHVYDKPEAGKRMIRCMNISSVTMFRWPRSVWIKLFNIVDLADCCQVSGAVYPFMFKWFADLLLNMSSLFSPGIGRTIHRHAKKHNCAVVRDFLGHGIGDFFHGPPDIYHCLNNYPGRGLLHSTNPVSVRGCVFRCYETWHGVHNRALHQWRGPEDQNSPGRLDYSHLGAYHYVTHLSQSKMFFSLQDNSRTA